jgi:hypothetical protein
MSFQIKGAYAPKSKNTTSVHLTLHIGVFVALASNLIDDDIIVLQYAGASIFFLYGRGWKLLGN